MVPPKQTASGLTPTAEHGVNLLWTFQLRKENAGLLEKLQASERTIQACASDSTRYFREFNDRVAALEARLSKIESEEKKDRQAIESWSAAVRTLRRKIDTEVETPEAATGTDPSTKIPSVEAISDTLRTQISTMIVNTMSNLEASNEKATTNHSAPTSINAPHLQPDSMTAEGPYATRHVISRTATRAAIRSFTNDVDLTQQRSLRVRQAEGSRRAKLPRLVQGTSQLKTYLTNATAAFSSVPNDRTNEVEFIATFLKGLREAKQRDILAKELQKAHPCRTGQGETVEIICRWDDVVEALKKTGLIDSEGQQERPAKRRKKILIPTEMMDTGMMN